ncbi:MAG: UDP-N-acetylmuramoyl-tripeptide--D-alanyl-D-alanine ligase [Actinomycetota bacterium]|nr:UDP-N-acetylmuramoyl-tripeptide--D-alanyl-D-alanine ligase [Actinomycetota bacterium]
MKTVSLGWTLEAAARAVDGTLVGGGDACFSHVTTDSRHDVAGSLFVALGGEHFDGHRFVTQAIEGDAVGVLVERGSGVDVEPRIEVASTGDALAALGVKRRDEIEVPVIAVTGSNGKTSTKDLLSAGLDGSWASPRSFNNEVGVPLTVLATPPDATALILEVGTRARGDIEWLSPIVRPVVSVVTNLGVVHMETFGSREGLEDAKYELVDALEAGGTAVLPLDEPGLQRGGEPAVITFGGAGADVEVADLTTDDEGRPSFTLRTSQGPLNVTLPLSGKYQALNAAAAVGVAIALGLDLEAFVRRLASATGSAWRMDVHVGRFTVVNDAYNASPPSVSGALETVAAMGRRPIAVLGVMAELGSVCEEEHERMGRLVGKFGFSELVVVGPDHGYALGFPREVHRAANIGDAVDVLAEIVEPGDVVLVKASRSVGLERLALRLREVASS